MKLFSWGRLKSIEPDIHNQYNPKLFDNLICGNRLSYGDICLNKKNITLNKNNKIISFDPKTEIVHLETGVTIGQLLNHFVEKSYFVYVTPGTKNVTVGGAVSNDVHGKEHHIHGSFGEWIEEIELINSEGTFICSKEENFELFKATIGGLGLTGFIKTVKMKLKRISGNEISRKTIKFKTIQEFTDLVEVNNKYTYNVAWFDSFSYNKGKLKGLFYVGEFNNSLNKRKGKRTNFLFSKLPSFLLNKLTIRILNWLIYNSKRSQESQDTVSYETFFYPLDKIQNWNHIYGKKGFYQFQCLLPVNNFENAFEEIMNFANRQGSFLSVLKIMSNQNQNSFLSFPKPGITVAMDFKNESSDTKKMISSMYDIVGKYQGRIYLAKDSLLTSEQFHQMYDASSFSKYKDKNLNSLMWERLNSEKNI